MIGLYAIKTENLPSRETLLKHVDIDVGEGKMRAWKKMSEEHAQASIAGILLLQYGMKQQGISCEGETLLYTKEGRPYWKRNEVDFSISHTDGLVVCAVESNLQGKSFGVGVDAERLMGRNEASMRRISLRWFSRKEQELFLNAPQELNFLRIWTGKEAIVKRNGKGLSGLVGCDVTELERNVRLAEYYVNETIITLCCHAESEPPSDILWLK